MNIDDDDGGATWLDQQLYHFHLAELDASPTRYNNRSMDGMSQTSTLIQPEVVCAAILKAHGYKVVRPPRSNPRGTQSQSRSPGTITPITPTLSTRLDIVFSRDEGVLQDVGDRLRAKVRRATLGPPRSREDLMTSLRSAESWFSDQLRVKTYPSESSSYTLYNQLCTLITVIHTWLDPVEARDRAWERAVESGGSARPDFRVLAMIYSGDVVNLPAMEIKKKTIFTILRSLRLARWLRFWDVALHLDPEAPDRPQVDWCYRRRGDAPVGEEEPHLDGDDKKQLGKMLEQVSEAVMCFDPPLHPHPFRAGADQSAKVFVQLCSQSTSYDILSSWDVYTLFHRPDYTTVQICSPILRDQSLLDTPDVSHFPREVCPDWGPAKLLLALLLVAGDRERGCWTNPPTTGSSVVTISDGGIGPVPRVSGGPSISGEIQTGGGGGSSGASGSDTRMEEEEEDSLGLVETIDGGEIDGVGGDDGSFDSTELITPPFLPHVGSHPLSGGFQRTNADHYSYNSVIGIRRGTRA
jgi:hypothetical protein